MDVKMTELRTQISTLTEQLERETAKQKYNAKMLSEMQIRQAVCEQSKKEAEEEIRGQVNCRI